MDIRLDFAEYLYSRLPKIYRYSDKDLILKSLIETFVEGGFNHVIEDAIRIPDLLDVDKCPKRFLPLVASMYGYTYSEELPELFQRRFLKNIVEMYKRKGTKSVLRFIARELTGFDCDIIENKDFNTNEIKVTGWDKRFEHYRNFILKLKAPYETSMLEVKEEVVKRVVKDFLPTNSQVLVVTAYWFEDKMDLTKQTIEEVLNTTVHEYLMEIKQISDFIYSKLDDKYKLKLKEVLYDIGLLEVSTEDSIKDIIQLHLTTTEKKEVLADTQEDAYKVHLKSLETLLVDLIGRIHTTICYNRVKMKDEGDSTTTYKDSRVLDDNSLLNISRCTLNSSFVLNGIFCFDTVTQNGKTDIIIL